MHFSSSHLHDDFIWQTNVEVVVASVEKWMSDINEIAFSLFYSRFYCIPLWRNTGPKLWRFHKQTNQATIEENVLPTNHPMVIPYIVVKVSAYRKRRANHRNGVIYRKTPLILAASNGALWRWRWQWRFRLWWRWWWRRWRLWMATLETEMHENG